MLGLETDVLLVSSDFLYFLTGGLRSVKEGSEAIRCSFMMYFSLLTALGAMVGPFKFHELCMNRFGPLFAHQASTKTPLPKPWHNVRFHYVHLRQHCGTRKTSSVEGHEGIDVSF